MYRYSRLIFILLLALAAPAPAREPFVIAYVQQADDPFYAAVRAYPGLHLVQRFRPIDGARAAIRESAVPGRRLGLDFRLVEITLGEGEDAATAIAAAAAEGTGVFILDLPLESMLKAATALEDRDVLLLNVRHDAVALRAETCPRRLFHTIPSLDMRSDALAQHLRARGWLDVLLLEGPAAADAAYSAAFQASARKFGLRIVAVRPFVLGHDPRLREQTNIRLLTGGLAHDIVFVADASGELGRHVPYDTYLPRPVVGDTGLVPLGWHWAYERHGAPQLNQRFERQAGRRMGEMDWAAWAAVRVVVEALSRTGATEIAALDAFLRSDALTFDTYKGAPGSFRPWNRQLRQPILVATHDAVIARAPLPEFLHEKNTLDTLGLDEPESRCRTP
jgi:ABC transporter substrate binding protein (PQQ-dependent alcohol dehydrogenase system)